MDLQAEQRQKKRNVRNVCECDILESWPHRFFRCHFTGWKHEWSARTLAWTNIGNNSIWFQQVNRIFSQFLSVPPLPSPSLHKYIKWISSCIESTDRFPIISIGFSLLRRRLLKFSIFNSIRNSIWLKFLFSPLFSILENEKKKLSIDPLISVLFFGYFNHVASYNRKWKRNQWNGNRKYKWESNNNNQIKQHETKKSEVANATQVYTDTM